ncbi:MAG: response regulator [Bacteroidales bacterium]
MQTRVAIIDDHRIVADGIKAILLGHPVFSVEYIAYSATHLHQTLGNFCPDLVLLDIILPDICGMELIPFFKEKCNAKVLMLTAEMDENTICQAVENGADGFLHKDVSSEEIIHAMETIMQGEAYFGQKLSSIIFSSYRKKVEQLQMQQKMPSISDREKEIIFLLSEGFCFKEIAEKLFISPRTVENHKNNLLQKLELKNTIQLVKFAIAHKIISL